MDRCESRPRYRPDPHRAHLDRSASAADRADRYRPTRIPRAVEASPAPISPRRQIMRRGFPSSWRVFTHPTAAGFSAPPASMRAAAPAPAVEPAG
jgi:hypothetical protein